MWKAGLTLSLFLVLLVVLYALKKEEGFLPNYDTRVGHNASLGEVGRGPTLEQQKAMEAQMNHLNEGYTDPDLDALAHNLYTN